MLRSNFLTGLRRHSPWWQGNGWEQRDRQLVALARAPFESKYAETVDRRDAQVMQQAFGRGVLVTKQTLNLDGRTVLIPAPLVLSLLAYRS